MAEDDSTGDEKPAEDGTAGEAEDPPSEGGSSDDSPTATGGGDGGHDKLARSMEKRADELEDRSQEVGKQISQTREDWESKQASESVPGAVGEPD